MKYLLTAALLLPACSHQYASRCTDDGVHEFHLRDGTWLPRLDCRGEVLTCYWSERTRSFLPLRWATDACVLDEEDERRYDATSAQTCADSKP